VRKNNTRKKEDRMRKKRETKNLVLIKKNTKNTHHSKLDVQVTTTAEVNEFKTSYRHILKQIEKQQSNIFLKSLKT
jgi:hypothetical protein